MIIDKMEIKVANLAKVFNGLDLIFRQLMFNVYIMTLNCLYRYSFSVIEELVDY